MRVPLLFISTDITINKANRWIVLHPTVVMTITSPGAQSVASSLQDERRVKVSESCSDGNSRTEDQAPLNPTTRGQEKAGRETRVVVRRAGTCR